MCLFEHEGKEIKLLPLSRSKPTEQKPVAPWEAKELNLISVKNLQHEMERDAHVMILIAREVPKNPVDLISSEIILVIKEFSDVFP